VNIPGSIQKKIRKSLGSDLIHSELLAGGSINEVFKTTLADKREFVLKYNFQAPESFFSSEAYGLKLLSKSGAKVPEVILLQEGDSECHSFILLEYFAPGVETKKSQEAFGRMLANLHSTDVSEFGLEKNNFIGTLQQINTPVRSTELCKWSEFFIENRLRVQADLGQQNGWFSRDFLELFLTKEKVIAELLDSCENKSSLLHGDLWSGNIYWAEDDRPVLIDPAVYYGHREVDLAFLELFGEPGDYFKGAYSEILPYEQGFELRKHVLNLYYLMVHANLFGGQYIDTVWRVLNVL